MDEQNSDDGTTHAVIFGLEPMPPVGTTQHQIDRLVMRCQELEREVEQLRADSVRLAQRNIELTGMLSLKALEERERCAKLCESLAPDANPNDCAWTIRTEWAADSEGPNGANEAGQTAPPTY